MEAATDILPVILTDAEKTQWSNKWRTYREQVAQLMKHRGQTYLLVLGQCTQLLQDKMKQDADWATVSASYDPLQLYRLIEKTILAQTENQYQFATVYNQEMALYSFCQEKLSNAQWYERFNTKVDVADAIGVGKEHPVLLEFVSQELYNDSFDNITADQKEIARADAKEWYLAYIIQLGRIADARHHDCASECSQPRPAGAISFYRSPRKTYRRCQSSRSGFFQRRGR